MNAQPGHSSKLPIFSIVPSDPNGVGAEETRAIAPAVAMARAAGLNV